MAQNVFERGLEPTVALTAGTRFGAYEITGSLGAGGMGEVYRATDTNLKRDVAIKILPPAFASDADRIARFQREAEALAALNHSNIAQIYGLERSGDSTALAMELVEGPTLADRIAEGPIPVDEAVGIARQIADALEAAHGRQIVHRDLKPANIKLSPDGMVKVLDFGIATAPESPVATSGRRSPALLTPALTEAGVLLGTAAYMSPEQARGRAVDERADIWAFGCVLYEMLTGQPAFAGEDVTTTLARVLEREANTAELPATLPSAVRHTIELCLEKDPGQRIADIRDVRLALEGRFDLAAQASGGAEAASPPIWRRGLPVTAAVVLTAAVAAVLAWNLRSEPGPVTVIRFAYVLPAGQTFRNAGRPVMALSPDGRRFVYNTADGLYLRSMGELEARRIPGTEESLTNPFFSADGQSVAYWALAGGQLKRVALSGGAPIVVADGVTNLFGASWSADGTILYGQPEGIYRVSANGGTPELVVRAQEGEQLYGPELLPDGDSVLFSAMTTGSWDEAQIAVQSLSTGKRNGLISGGSDAHYVPTGHLVYALGDGLFAIAFDAATLKVAGGPVSLVQGVARGALTAAANYGISKDGTLVYVSGIGSGPTGATPVWVDHDGTEEPLGLSPCTCASPAVSPDGTRLVFDFPTPDQTDADVWVWSLAQHTRTRLTFEPGFQLGAVWSPESTRLAYESLGQGLFVRPADGTGMPEPLLESSNTVIPWAWLANDELIFSEDTQSTGFDIGMLGLTGDHERRSLLATKFNEYRPAASPDERWLAYQSDESGQYEIYVRPLPDVDAGKWQVSSGGGIEPKWSRDGHTLVYLGPKSLMETAVGDGTAFVHDTPKSVLDRQSYAYNDLPPRSYEISPDGQRFLLMKPGGAGTGDDTTAPPQILVVTNWSEELKQRVPTK